jgi:hypothetical protein
LLKKQGFVPTTIVTDHLAAYAAAMSDLRLSEPIQKVVESEESVVIPCLAPGSLSRGARCGSLNTAVPPNVRVCAIRAT